MVHGRHRHPDHERGVEYEEEGRGERRDGCRERRDPQNHRDEPRSGDDLDEADGGDQIECHLRAVGTGVGDVPLDEEARRGDDDDQDGGEGEPIRPDGGYQQRDEPQHRDARDAARTEDLTLVGDGPACLGPSFDVVSPPLSLRRHPHPSAGCTEDGDERTSARTRGVPTRCRARSTRWTAVAGTGSDAGGGIPDPRARRDPDSTRVRHSSRCLRRSRPRRGHW